MESLTLPDPQLACGPRKRGIVHAIPPEMFGRITRRAVLRIEPLDDAAASRGSNRRWRRSSSPAT